MSQEKAKSYRNTAIIGLSSIYNIFLSVIRNKIFAIFLGASGIGFFGIINDFVNSVVSVGSLGINNSGVQAVSREHSVNGHVAKLYRSLIRVYSFISFFLLFSILIFASSISEFLSGTDHYAWALQIASITILFRFRSTIQSILITGMKRVGMLTKGNLYQATITTIIGILLVYFFQLKAIPFLILSFGVVTWAITYYQSRKIYRHLPVSDGYLSPRELSPIFILGISSLWASFMESIVTLAGKSWINHRFGSMYLGYYQVAIGFTSTYIGFITSSIISDYYPRLVSKVAEGVNQVNDFVNHQISVSMALIMPLLFVMLTFSKLFILLLFSSEFITAVPLLGYTVAGTFIQVVSWPIAFVFLAHRATKTYILTETVGNGSMLILGYLAVQTGIFTLFGLAYLLHYIIYLFLITVLFYSRFSGKISFHNIRLFFFNALIITGIILSKNFLDESYTYFIGSCLVVFYFYRSREEYTFMFRTIFNKL